MPELISVDRIWDHAPHNGFTDLIRFQDRWWCVFREAEGHATPGGITRVISSDDGDCMIQLVQRWRLHAPPPPPTNRLARQPLPLARA